MSWSRSLGQYLGGSFRVSFWLRLLVIVLEDVVVVPVHFFRTTGDIVVVLPVFPFDGGDMSTIPIRRRLFSRSMLLGDGEFCVVDAPVVFAVASGVAIDAGIRLSGDDGIASSWIEVPVSLSSISGM